MLRTSSAAVLLLVAFWSCQDPDSTQQHVASKPRPIFLRLAEVFRVGTEGTNVLFGSIGSISLSSAGEVFVEDPQVRTYYVFSPTGELVATVGRRGKAPGEFEDMSGLVVGPGDSVYVFDGSASRLSVFDPALRFAYSLRIEQRVGGGFGFASLFSTSTPTKLIGVKSTGYVVQYESLFLPLPNLIDQTGDTDASAFLVNRNGEVARKPVARLPGREFIYATSGQEIIALLRPFGRTFLFQMDAEGFVYSGWNESIDIEKRATNGRLHGRISRKHDVEDVTLEDLATVMEEMPRDAKRLLRESDLPETLPAFETFIVDDQGRVWLQEDLTRIVPDSSATWSILNVEGQIIAETKLPAYVTLQVVRSGRAFGNGRDASGTPFVVAYRISN